MYNKMRKYFKSNIKIVMPKTQLQHIDLLHYYYYSSYYCDIMIFIHLIYIMIHGANRKNYNHTIKSNCTCSFDIKLNFTTKEIKDCNVRIYIRRQNTGNPDSFITFRNITSNLHNTLNHQGSNLRVIVISMSMIHGIHKLYYRYNYCRGYCHSITSSRNQSLLRITDTSLNIIFI